METTHLTVSTDFETALQDAGGAWCVNELKVMLSDLNDDTKRDEVACTADKLVELAWGKIHTGYWKDVPTAWRDLYALANFVVAVVLERNKNLLEAINKLDLGLLMGGPTFKAFLQNYVQKIHNVVQLERGQEKMQENKNENGGEKEGEEITGKKKEKGIYIVNQG